MTSLAVSRDHKTVYVGDEKGRVFSWTVSAKPSGKFVDHWVKDEAAEACIDCQVLLPLLHKTLLKYITVEGQAQLSNL